VIVMERFRGAKLLEVEERKGWMTFCSCDELGRCGSEYGII
jgi:ferredoxin